MKETRDKRSLGIRGSRGKVVFKPYVQNQLWLLPPSLGDLIPPDHIARLVNAIIDEMDIAPLLSGYKGGGTSSYHPRMMLKALVYGYIDKRYSSRGIEKALKENVVYMWLCGMQQPDHNTINSFRNSNLKNTVKEVFAYVLSQLVEKGIVRLSEYYVDGTKMESVAGRYTFVWAKNTDRYKASLLEKVAELIAHIESVNEKETSESTISEEPVKESTKPPTEDTNSKDDNHSDKEKSDSASVVNNSEELKEKILELKSKVKEQGKERERLLKKIDNLQTKHLPKLMKYEQQEQILNGRNSYSKTDPDATFMRTKEDHLGTGQLKPSYNIQAGTEKQFIINYTIHQTPSDMASFIQHMDDTLTMLERLGIQNPLRIGADAGYGSEQNYEFLEAHGIEAFVKYPGYYRQQKNNYKKAPFHPDTLFYNEVENFYVCPMGQRMEFTRTSNGTSKNGYAYQNHHFQAARCEGCPLRTSCHKSKENRTLKINLKSKKYRHEAKERLDSLRGLQMKKQRNVDVEPVFGHIKQDRGFRRFLLTGIQGVSTEFGLLAIAHNFKKWWVEMQKSKNDEPKPDPIATQKAQNDLQSTPFFDFLEIIGHHPIFSFLTNFSMNFLASHSVKYLRFKNIFQRAF